MILLLGNTNFIDNIFEIRLDKAGSKEVDDVGPFARLVDESLKKLPPRNRKLLERNIYSLINEAEDEYFEQQSVTNTE